MNDEQRRLHYAATYIDLHVPSYVEIAPSVVKRVTKLRTKTQQLCDEKRDLLEAWVEAGKCA